MKTKASIFFARCLLTCGGIGYVPKGSGTVASLVALFFWAWADLSPVTALVLILGLIAISGPLVIIHERALQARGESDIHDRSEIVLDEWIGMGLSVLLVPTEWPWLLLAFFLFRLFDIWKPWGVRFFDRRQLNGYGVTLDDVVAGIYAWILTYGAYNLYSSFYGYTSN